jgi:predicted nucleic acid-binding protein
MDLRHFRFPPQKYRNALSRGIAWLRDYLFRQNKGLALSDPIVVVDTNIISYLIKMRNRRLNKDLTRTIYYANFLEDRKMLQAFPTEAELLVWLNHIEEETWKEQCAQGIREIAGQTIRIDTDSKVVAKWAEIATKGRELGRIPLRDLRYTKWEPQMNDIWIAACALALGLPLVSDDRKGFEWMESAVGLRLISFPDAPQQMSP